MTTAVAEMPDDDGGDEPTMTAGDRRPEWEHIQRDPRVFQCLPVSVLICDQRIQREIRDETVAVIVNEFEWSKIEAATVTPVGDGTYRVIEGQHRALALQQIAKILGLDMFMPCMVLSDRLTTKEQARIALGIVNGRRSHSALELWKLRYNRGDEHELFATVAMDDRGVRVGKSPSAMTIGAVATVRRIVHGGQFTPDYGAQLLGDVLDVVMEAWPTHDHESNVGRWDRNILLAVSEVVHKHPKANRPRLATVLRVRPTAQWVSIGRGTDHMPDYLAITDHLVKDYNRNLRNGRLG